MSPLPDPQVLDWLPDATLVIDASGRIEYCNDAAARLLARPRQELIGAAVTDAVPLLDEQRRDWWQCARPLEADARLLPRIPETDLTVNAGGRQRPVTLTAARVADSGTGVSHLVVSLRRAERRQRLDAARSDLVSTVSHEIRSPLTSVKGFVKTLLAKWDRFSDAQKQQMLATVNEDADRVTRLLSELLDVSRIDAGRLHVHRQMVDVPAIARRVVERLDVGEHRGRARTELPADVPKLYADPDKIEQIFTNLVENALKYAHGAVVITAEVRDDDVEFMVRDEGDGIPRAHLAHLFTKFFRPPGERRTGTGLGLYISKGLVQAHGGRIWAESTEGEGSTFHFTLPRGGLELAGIDVRPRA